MIDKGRVERAAELSDDGLYRYWLARRWDGDDQDAHPVTWVMLNPSTADHQVDDNTIRRCMGFTDQFGYVAMAVVNLFALRSRDPKALARTEAEGGDPVGPLNDEHLKEVFSSSALVIAAWGAHAFAQPRAVAVRALAEDAGHTLLCLGRTKDGHPKHPLYLPWNAALEPL